MDAGTAVSFVYASVNIVASYGLNKRLRCGPYLGCLGAALGFTTACMTDARGLMLNTPFYAYFGYKAITSGEWKHEPWFVRRESNEGK